MRRCLTAMLVLGLVSITARDAAAQPSAGDFAAYFALTKTPVGAFAPMNAAPFRGQDANYDAFAVRLSHYKYKFATDGNNEIGATFLHKAGTNAVIGGTIGYDLPSCSGCDGTLLLGGDVYSALWSSAASQGSTIATSINLQGSLGYGRYMGSGGGDAFSLAVGVPFQIAMDQADKSRFSVFVTPGYGWGQLSGGGGSSESGTRPMIGAGGEWRSPAGWGLHAGLSQIVIEDGHMNFGLGFNLKLK